MLSKPQAVICRDESRFRVVVAGRRFGKTFLATRELARFARLPDQQVFYIAPSYRQAKQIIWEPLKSRLSELNWIEKANESDLSVILVNGSTIALRSADNFDSMRGVGLNFAVFDEFADQDYRVWSEVIRPALSDKQGHAMFIGTPKGLGNHLYDVYQQGKTLPNWSSHTYTTADGGNVSLAELEDAKRDLDIRTYRQEYEATFETYAGVIYYGFTDANIIPYKETDVPQQILVWCDFNVSPMSAVVAVQTSWGHHIIDEVVIYNSNTNELVDEIKSRYGARRVTAFPDPAGQQRKTSANGQTDIKILENAGWQVKYHRSHPGVKDRINAVNSAFSSVAGDIKIKIDPRCKRTIESFRKHSYKEGTTVPDKDSGHDHMTDAVGYGVEYLYPIKRDVAPQRPLGTWGAY
jgi:hypothetical protein